MAVFTGINLSGDSTEDIVDAITALNRSLEYQMANLDDDNIRELDYSKMVGGPPTNADNTEETLPATLGINFTKIGVNYIYTGTIEANKINVGTLTGFVIRTAPSGRRVEIDAGGLHSYDEFGVRRIDITNTDPTLGNHYLSFYGTNGTYTGSISGDTFFSIHAAPGREMIIDGQGGVRFFHTMPYIDFANVPIRGLAATAKFG